MFVASQLASMIRHMPCPSGKHYVIGDNIEVAFYELCAKVDNADEVIDVARMIAERIADGAKVKHVMSVGLKSMPLRDVRRVLLSYGATLDATDPFYLCLASGTGNYDVVKSALDNGFHGKLLTEMNIFTMLTYATYSGEVSVVGLLLNKCPNPNVNCVINCFLRGYTNILDLFWNTPSYSELFRSSSEWWPYVRDIGCARWMLRHYSDNSNAITSAIINNSKELVMFLIENVGLTMPDDVLPAVVGSYPRLELLDYLIYHGANIHARDDEGNTVIHKAPLYMRYFMDYDDTHLVAGAQNDIGMTVVHVVIDALRNDNVDENSVVDVIKLYMSQGHDIKARDCIGASVFDRMTDISDRTVVIDYLKTLY